MTFFFFCQSFCSKYWHSNCYWPFSTNKPCLPSPTTTSLSLHSCFTAQAGRTQTQGELSRLQEKQCFACLLKRTISQPDLSQQHIQVLLHTCFRPPLLLLLLLLPSRSQPREPTRTLQSTQGHVHLGQEWSMPSTSDFNTTLRRLRQKGCKTNINYLREFKANSS